MDTELRAKLRFIHDKHYISKDSADVFTDKDINSALDDTVALVQQEIAKAEERVIRFASSPKGRTELKVTHKYICSICSDIRDELSLEEHKEK